LKIRDFENVLVLAITRIYIICLKTIWHRTFKYNSLRWKRSSKLFLWKILVFVEITWILRIGSYWCNKLRKKNNHKTIFFGMIWAAFLGEHSSLVFSLKQEFWELCLIYTIIFCNKHWSSRESISLTRLYHILGLCIYKYHFLCRSLSIL
jgi:hypothetical protein